MPEAMIVYLFMMNFLKRDDIALDMLTKQIITNDGGQCSWLNKVMAKNNFIYTKLKVHQGLKNCT